MALGRQGQEISEGLQAGGFGVDGRAEAEAGWDGVVSLQRAVILKLFGELGC